MVTTRVGCAFNDARQNLFNKKTKQKVIVTPDYWELKDKSFDQISTKLIQNPFGNEHIIKCHTPISDQGSIGSCVANAWCDALEILLGLENQNNVVQLSRMFAYWVFRDLVGDQFKDKGSFIRAGAQQLRKIGVVDEKYYTYDTKKVFSAPELDLYTMASNNRIDSFYRITSYGDAKLADIEQAIRSNHPVVFGTIVGKDFMKYSGGGQVFGLPKTSEGRHAMIIIGVKAVSGKKQFLVRNSWSKAWGDDGLVWLNEEYIKSSHTSDIWVATRMSMI